MTTPPITDQPPPVPSDRPAVWDLVIADMRARDQVGRERYGTPLQAHNGRDAMVDAYQEALDLSVYLRQRIEEERASRARQSSQVRINAEHDPSYAPYCMRCPGLRRMARVEPFLWRCPCGAEHDERNPVPAPTGERVPSPRWTSRHGSLWLAAGDYRAQVMEHGGWTLWLCNPNAGGGWVAKASGDEGGTAAQLAAEDALIAVHDEIARAVGR